MRRCLPIIVTVAAMSLAFAAVLAAQRPVIVRTAIEPNSILIGEQTLYSCVVISAADADMQMPAVERLLGGFDIISHRSETTRFFGSIRRIERYAVTRYDAGEHTIEGPAVIFTSHGVRAKVIAPRAHLIVKSAVKGGAPEWRAVAVAEPSSPFHDRRGAGGAIDKAAPARPIDATVRFNIIDIAPPLFVMTSSEIFGGVLISAALILTAAFGAAFFQRRRQMRLAPAPREEALRAIGELEKKASADAGDDAREIFFAISSIVRHYVKIVLALGDREEATNEFLASLKGGGSVAAALGQDLEGFLLTCDRVKYSGYGPAPHEIVSALATARNFVESLGKRLPKGSIGE